MPELPAQEDPFAAPSGNTVTGQPENGGQANVVQLDVDYIEISHETANALIRGLKGAQTGGGGVREAALREVAAGRGKRLHRQWLNVRNHGRSRSGSVQELANPTEYDPVMMTVVNKAGSPPHTAPLLAPATPQSFEFQPLGWIMDAEVQRIESSGQFMLNLYADRIGHTGNLKWSRAEGAADLATISHSNLSASFPLRRGEWMLAGLLRLPNPEGAGLTGPLAPGRILTFVRPLWEELESPPPPAIIKPVDPSQAAGVLYEWLETSREAAEDLSARFPAVDDGPALRQELQRLTDQGKASLLESAYQLTAEGKASMKSTAVVRNGDESPPSGRGLPSPEQQPKRDYPVYSPLPFLPSHFSEISTGTLVTTELSGDAAWKSFDVNMETQFVRVVGRRRHGEANAELERLEFAKAEPGGNFRLRPREPRLIAALEALPPASLETRRGPVGAPVSGQRWFVFVTLFP